MVHETHHTSDVLTFKERRSDSRPETFPPLLSENVFIPSTALARNIQRRSSIPPTQCSVPKTLQGRCEGRLGGLLEGALICNWSIEDVTKISARQNFEVRPATRNRKFELEATEYLKQLPRNQAPITANLNLRSGWRRVLAVGVEDTI